MSSKIITSLVQLFAVFSNIKLPFLINCKLRIEEIRNSKFPKYCIVVFGNTISPKHSHFLQLIKLIQLLLKLLHSAGMRTQNRFKQLLYKSVVLRLRKSLKSWIIIVTHNRSRDCWQITKSQGIIFEELIPLFHLINYCVRNHDDWGAATKSNSSVK